MLEECHLGKKKAWSHRKGHRYMEYEDSLEKLINHLVISVEENSTVGLLS